VPLPPSEGSSSASAAIARVSPSPDAIRRVVPNPVPDGDRRFGRAVGAAVSMSADAIAGREELLLRT
jgi:hypothetical protein